MFTQSPFLTRILLRQASRRANLSAEQKTQLEEILSSRQNLIVASQALDDMKEPDGQPVATTAKLGDGTLLKLLIDNLPAIIAAIMEIIKAFPAVAAAAERLNDVHAAYSEGAAATGNFSSRMPTEFALPPGLAVIAAQLGQKLLAAVMPVIEQEIKSLIAKYATN